MVKGVTNFKSPKINSSRMKTVFLNLFVCCFVLFYSLCSCSNEAKEIDVSYAEISLNKDSLMLEVGATERLLVSYFPADTEYRGHTWESSNFNVASVDDTGLVTALSEGEAVITAIALNGKSRATCRVIVMPKHVEVTNISLNIQKDTLITGDKITLEAKIEPSNATNQKIIWKSKDANVVSVDAQGIVTAISGGETDVTATVYNSNKTAQCHFVVLNRGVEISKQELSNISSTSVLIKAKVKAIGIDIQEMGIVYSTKQTPTIDDDIVKLSITENISYTLTGLESETTYYTRIYVKTDDGIQYGDQVDFTTEPAVGFSSFEVNSITSNSAFVSGVIESYGLEIQNVGILFSETSELIDGGKKIELSGSQLEYTLKSLEPETTYYVCLFAFVDNEYYYSHSISFTTLGILKTHFELTDVYYSSSLDQNDLLLSSEAPYGVNSIEICYSRYPNPKVTDYVAKAYLDSDDGKLKLKLTDVPSGDIYLRAYTNSGGEIEYYDDEVKVSTFSSVIKIQRDSYKIEDYWESQIRYGKITIKYACEILYDSTYEIETLENRGRLKKGKAGGFSYDPIYMGKGKETIEFQRDGLEYRSYYEDYVWGGNEQSFIRFTNVDSKVNYYYGVELIYK